MDPVPGFRMEAGTNLGWLLVKGSSPAEAEESLIRLRDMLVLPTEPCL